MVEQAKNQVKPPMLAHMGILVKDIDKALEYYSANFGWGQPEVAVVELKGFTYKGKLENCRLKVAMYPGPILVEIFQLLDADGDSPYSWMPAGKSEYLHHMGFAVDDLDKSLADLEKRGIKPIFSHCFPEIGFRWVYINSDKDDGIIYELTEQRKEIELKDTLGHWRE